MASWDLDVVLAALAKPLFEPLESASLKHISTKVAFVVAITSMKRVGELHALSVCSECYRMDPGRRSISLRPNSSFLCLSDSYVNIPFILSAYDPPGAAEEPGAPSGMLCPAWALAVYVERTRAVRTTDQLFFCYGESPGDWVIKAEALSLDRGHDYDSIPPGWKASAGICGGIFNKRCGCILGSTERRAAR